MKKIKVRHKKRITDYEVMKRYTHFQIEIETEIDYQGERYNQNGYSHLIYIPDFLIAKNHDDYLDRYIARAIKHSISIFRDAHPEISYSSLMSIGGGYIKKVSLIFRTFTTENRFTGDITPAHFRQLYMGFKKAYGAGAKEMMARKFGVKKRSIENYLMGRLPKTARFRRGLQSLMAMEKYKDYYKFPLENLFGMKYDKLNQSILTDISGLIRNHIFAPDEELDIYTNSVSFLQLLGSTISTIKKHSQVIKWLISTVSISPQRNLRRSK